MKALFLTNEYPPHIYGGAGVHVEYLTREISKKIDVEVRCFGDQDFHNSGLSVRGYEHDTAIFSATDKKLASALAALYKCLMFNIVPIDADIVHCHTWYSHMGGIIAKKAYGIPLVITTHSLEPLRPWKREQLGLGYELSLWVEKTALEMADAIVAVSEGMKQDILRYFNVEEEKIKVIYNGIDTDEYKPVDDSCPLSKYGIKQNVPYVLFVGRITRQKGIIHLVNAIRHINRDAQIVLCAGQPDTPEIKQEMEEGVKAIQKERGNVFWIQKMVPRDEIIPLYSNAAVFCCPSIYEPFGIINLEAMACATPVVASAVGGIVEIVRHKETGLLVEFEQHKESPFEAVYPESFAKDLADAINTILDNEAMAHAMGEAGRKLAVERFSWRSIAQQIVDLYGTLI